MKLEDLKLLDSIADEIDDIDVDVIPDPVYSCYEEYIDETLPDILRKILNSFKPGSDEYEYLMAWHLQTLEQLPKNITALHKKEKLEAQVDAYLNSNEYRKLKQKEYYEEEAEDKAKRDKLVIKIDKELRAKDVPIKRIFIKINEAIEELLLEEPISRSTYNRIRKKCKD